MSAYNKCIEKKKEDKKVGNALREATDNLRDKAEIDRIKKLLSEKIKDPKLAQKAALIISEMLNKKD